MERAREPRDGAVVTRWSRVRVLPVWCRYRGRPARAAADGRPSGGGSVPRSARACSSGTRAAAGRARAARRTRPTRISSWPGRAAFAAALSATAGGPTSTKRPVAERTKPAIGRRRADSPRARRGGTRR